MASSTWPEMCKSGPRTGTTRSISSSRQDHRRKPSRAQHAPPLERATVVVKGGSKTWTLSYREGVPYDKRLSYIGFRCVLSVEGPTGQPAPPVQDTPQPPGARRLEILSGRSSVPF